MTTPSTADLRVRSFPGRDGAELQYRELGVGRPVVLLHGYFSSAVVNWVRYGHAATIAARGRRVIMPDLRGHGGSAKPHSPADYPPDILVEDGLALLVHLGLTNYDLGGYSLGARTALRMSIRGATPGRMVVAGMGLSGMLHTGGRGAYFRRVLTHLGSFERGSAEWMTEAFLKTMGGDALALLRVLDSFVDTNIEDLARIETPTLVVNGAEDGDNGSGDELAAALRCGAVAVVPGNHMSSVTRPELGAAIADFLAA